ncbi:thermopsin [Acidianus sulfidivorans JP7]|uniref:Thermopsin n=1 Tax=Acidianus sulfidivorans JP7 TaxID=619593 RepID=A0A2U9IQV1_9CREN|nr:thermopsin [Acidianus sulfidivorans]AWR98354.1 thermopsin [Acidianus sulfidivorans JP7]
MQRNIIVLLLISSFLVLEAPLITISLPTGVAAYNGPIYTNAVLGYANITSLSAYNPNPPSGIPPYGASLQLNVMLQANSSEGEYYFWLQDVAQFITNESVVSFVDNVWNDTTPFAGVNNISGNGECYFFLALFSHGSYYAYSTNYFNYKFPLSFYLIINESYNSQGINVDFGYVIIQNGRITPPNPVFYDKVFIPVNNLISASIVIANQTTPNATGLLFIYLGNDLDSEFVWGGYGNGENTTFLSMSSYLALLYMKDEKWVPFPQVFTYGNDTAESANNLHVSIAKNGDAYVTTGTPNYQLLTNNFNPSIPGFLYLDINNSKIPFYINGTLTYNFQGYITEPIRLDFIHNYSVNSSSFAVLQGNYPSLIQPNVSWFKVINITPNYTYYYLVKVNSPIPVYATINGQNVTLTSSWMREGTIIDVENVTYYISSTAREVITSISPNSSISLNSPITITVKTITQYYVNVTSPIPVYAIINGENVTLNSSWFNAGTKIDVENVTYYPTSNERYIIITINPSSALTVNYPINISVNSQKQYLTVINNVSSWYNAGTKVQLNASVPFYEVGKFVGTYNVPVGSYITINGPTEENLILSLNFVVIGGIIAAIGIAVALIIVLRKA